MKNQILTRIIDGGRSRVKMYEKGRYRWPSVDQVLTKCWPNKTFSDIQPDKHLIFFWHLGLLEACIQSGVSHPSRVDPIPEWSADSRHDFSLALPFYLCRKAPMLSAFCETGRVSICFSYSKFMKSSHLGKICLVSTWRVLSQHFVPRPQKPKVWIKGCNTHYCFDRGGFK